MRNGVKTGRKKAAGAIVFFAVTSLVAWHRVVGSPDGGFPVLTFLTGAHH